MSCLKDLKLSVIRKLKDVYYVKNPIKIKEDQLNVKIIHFNREEFQYYTKHYFLLADDERLFTSLDEAIEYCNNNNYQYDIVKCKQYILKSLN